MTYHLWTTGKDAYGLVPPVFARQRSGQRDRKTYDVESADLGGKPLPIPLEQETFMEGPPRHVDLVDWRSDGSPRGLYVVVSARVHALLQRASLPPHAVFEADIQFAKTHQKKAGAGHQAYFLYAFRNEDQIDAFDLTKTELSCTVALISDRARFDHRLPPGSVSDGSAAWAIAKQRCPEGGRPLVLPAALQGPIDARIYGPVLDFASPHFPLAIKDLDLIYLPHEYEPRVSDALRAAFVAMGATAMTFKDPWDDARIVVSTTREQIEARAARLLSAASAPPASAPEDAAFAAALVRRAEVLSRSDRVRTARKKQPPAEDVDERALREIEARLDVLLPASYRAALSTRTLPKRGKFRFFEADELRTLEQIDPRWSEKSCPEAVRALLVAIDGHGDYLGYFLRPDSSTQLDDMLMHFHHETAAVTKSRTKLKA